MSDNLTACVQALEAVLSCTSLPFDNETVGDALEAAGIIMWHKVGSDGEVDAHFDGAEDLEPGDVYWTTTKKWAEIVAASKL